MTDEQIIEVLRRGLSASDEEFRERLLARCLDALAAADTRRVGSRPERLTPVLELSDDDLGLLAAAGDPWPPASLASRPDATRLA